MAKDDATFEPALFAEQGVSLQGETQTVSPDYGGYEFYRAHRWLKGIVEGKTDAESVIKAMESSGLCGLGVAGFPAGRKRRIVNDQVAPKLMAVNIDEGEPGTFKDRTYLECDPYRFLEGLLIAASVVGIDACYISIYVMNITAAASCSRLHWQNFRQIPHLSCPPLSYVVVQERIFAVKSLP